MSRSIEDLLAIMSRLRDPEHGCPWDLEQDFSSIAPYTVEEAYEVADAIERGALDELRGELGDLLLQVVIHAQMAREQGKFDFGDVVEAICEKMICRHPHVFADSSVSGRQELHQAWEQHKERERDQRSPRQSALDGVALALPALLRSEKLQRRAARVGFDWDQVAGVVGKCREELAELEAELACPGDGSAVAEELGDLLFSCVNLARHAGVAAEQALQASNRKFERRFHAMERLLQGTDKKMQDLSLPELDALWKQVKRAGHCDSG